MMADSKVGALQTHFGKYAYGSILVWGGYGWKSGLDEANTGTT